MLFKGNEMLTLKRYIMVVLLCMPAFAYAGEIKTDIIYPKQAVGVAAGEGEVGLWVEDVRVDKSFGRAVDGEYLVPASDVAASLYAHMVSSLKAAGYQVIPYNSDMTNGMLVRIQSIEYSASREMIKSKVGVSVALESKMNSSSSSTRTYRAVVEDQFALSPSAEENAKTIGLGLATAAASVLADLKLSDSAQPETAGQ